LYLHSLFALNAEVTEDTVVLLCRLLRQGMHDLKVWLGVEADGSGWSTTPGKISGQLDEMSRVAKVIMRICGLTTNGVLY